MESLRQILQDYSQASLTLGSHGDVERAVPASAPSPQSTVLASPTIPSSGTDRAGLERSLKSLSKRNEKYFVIGMTMAVVLFLSLIVVAFLQLNQTEVSKAVPPIFGSSAALVVWRTLKTWREKNYTDCVLALVPNVDDDTLKSIVAVLLQKM